jgi:RNA polymerase sigma-70 factor (ECF subfamily)
VYSSQRAASPHNRLPQEREWIVGLRAGRVEAFDAIVLEYRELLQHLALRLLGRSDVADDVVQDVFVWLWEHRDTINADVNLRAYLYTATRHRALQVVRHEEVEERWTLTLDADMRIPGMGTPEHQPDRQAEQGELSAAVARAFDTLSPRVRQVAILRWQDGLSREEIAVVLGVAVPTVKNQLAVAVRMLRVLLRDFAVSRRGEVQ